MGYLRHTPIEPPGTAVEHAKQSVAESQRVLVTDDLPLRVPLTSRELDVVLSFLRRDLMEVLGQRDSDSAPRGEGNTV